MFSSLPARAACVCLVLTFFAYPVAAVDYAFVVNLGTDAGDASLADGFCDTNPTSGNQNQCTLRAAIQQANNVAPDTLHKITFSVPKVTLTGDLPAIIQPTVIDGSGGTNGRVEIDGNDHGCFNANSDPGDSSGDPFPSAPEANNSRFENLVIYGCTGLAAIDLSGHGYVVSNSYIGTDATGDAKASNANTGRGINFSSAQEDGLFPAFPPGLPPEFTDIASIILFLGVAATDLPPTVITGNVISGNESHGIDIHGKYTSTAIVFDNKIGVNKDGDDQIPNGVAGGSAEYGVYINAGAYMNFVGLDNIIAGHDLDTDGDGIHISTGAVPFPNFVFGNFVGASPFSATPFVDDFGNGQSGINVSFARPTTATDVSSDPPYVVNPLELGAIIGPGNIVGHNGQTGDDACDPSNINCAQGGILVSGGTTIGIRIFGNLVGISDPTSIVDIGNHGDGINVVGTEIEIGGATLPEGNIIASNDRHGLVIRGGSSTNNVVARANYIGTTPLGGALGNAGFGVWLRASGNQIGGTSFDNERNTIAYNGDHGIKVDGGSSVYGNLIQHNAFSNFTGLAIDLDQTSNAYDDTDNDPVVDRTSPAFNYANWQQNTITLTSAAGSGTSWTLRSARNRNYRIEFFQGDAATSALTHLCDVNTTTSSPDDQMPLDPDAGMASGLAGCAAAPAGSFITATVTDITPTSGSEPDRPGFPDDSAINNTSELSAPAQVLDEIEFSSAVYNVAENGVSLNVTLTRTGSGEGAASVDVVDLLTGSATSGGVDYSYTSPTTVNWADNDLADKTVTINVADDSIWENIETIVLELQNVSGAVIGAESQATVNINDAGNDLPSFAIDDVTVTEGTDATITFTVTKSGTTALASSVNFSASNGSATSADDFSGTLSGTLNFAAGDTTQQVVLTIDDDSTFESQETFTVGLNTPVDATISDDSGTGTIDDDDAPTFTIDDVSLSEGNAGTTAFTFTVTMSNATAVAITVDWASADGTATIADTDYTADNDTVTFPAGPSLTQQFTILVNGDATPESNETFFVNLSNASAGSISDAQGVGTILNDDNAATELNIGDASATEGTDATMTFTVTRSGDTSGTSSVNYAVNPGTAGTPGDYTANSPATLSGTLNFAGGETIQTVVLNVVNDTVFEPTEGFTVDLSGAVDALIVDPTGNGTITDDDTSSLSIDDPSATEGTDPSITFTVTRSGDDTQVASVNYTVTAGSAGTPGDYTGTLAGTLNFASGDNSETVVLTVVNDTTFEPTETFTVTLSSPSNVTISDGSGTGTINDDDSAATISIGDVAQPEGNAANPMTFTVTLSNPSAQQITVDFGTANGVVDPATAGSDYTANSGTVTFVAGDVSETVTVQILGDTTDEADETLVVNLTNPTNAAIADNQATGTIQNDDAPTPTFTVDNVTLAEGNAGTTAFDFTVSLAPVSASPTSVLVATANGTATVADSDYATNSQTLNFAAGASSQTFTVLVNGDTKLEGNESFTVTLANPTGGAAVSGSGTGQISNDDAVPTISISDVSQFELDGGSSNFVFDVTLSNASASTITVNFQTANGTATLANADYVANSGSVIFSPGQIARTISVVVNGDTAVEPSETFTVTLSSPTGATIADGTGVGTILDDDGDPAFVVDDPNATEGTDPTIVFTVNRTGNTAPTVTVEYVVTAGTATTPGDYTASDPFTGTLTFLNGVTSQTVTLNVIDDAVYEPAETIAISLFNPSVDTTIADPSGTGTIVDDLPQPTVSIGDVTQPEGDAGTTNFIFTVTLSSPSSQTVTVDFATADGTATAGSDYASNSGTVTFPPGSTSQTVTVQVNGDTTTEANETFFVNLTNAANATTADAQGLGTITNNDAAGAAIPALGARELAMLALLLAAVALMALKRA